MQRHAIRSGKYLHGVNNINLDKNLDKSSHKKTSYSNTDSTLSSIQPTDAKDLFTGHILRPHGDLCPNPTTKVLGGPHALCSLPVGQLCLVRWINMENWHSPAWSRHDHQKLSKIHILESGAVFFLLFFICIGCVANCVWSLFYGYLMHVLWMMVSSSFFLLMWYLLILFDCFVWGMFLFFFWCFSNFGWRVFDLLLSWIGLPHPNPNTPILPPEVIKAIRWPLPRTWWSQNFFHSGVYPETSLAKVVQWIMKQKSR